MKKIFLAVFSLVLLAGAGCAQQPTTPPFVQNTTSTLQTYKNGTYGFTFTYPANMVFVTPNYPLLQDKIVQLNISHTDYPNTNFSDAAFSVSASYAETLSECLAINAPENGDGFKNTTEISDITFYYTKSAGAAAGNRYDATVYRAFVGDKLCLELNQTIHTGNIGNYPEGTVTEIDKTEVQNRLDAIHASFKLTP